MKVVFQSDAREYFSSKRPEGNRIMDRRRANAADSHLIRRWLRLVEPAAVAALGCPPRCPIFRTGADHSCTTRLLYAVVKVQVGLPAWAAQTGQP